MTRAQASSRADFTDDTDKDFAPLRLCVSQIPFRPKMRRLINERRRRILTQRRKDAKEQHGPPFRRCGRPWM